MKKTITIKFYNCEKKYTKQGATRFLYLRFKQTKNKTFVGKIGEINKGKTEIVLGGI